MPDAEEVFDLLKDHGQDLMLHDIFEIRKQNALEEGEEPEPEPKECIMAVLKSTEGVWLTEDSFKVLEDIASNEQ
jgi:hypothetical protein